MPFNKIIFRDDAGGSSSVAQTEILRAISRVSQAISSSADGTVADFEVVKEQNKISIQNGEITFDIDDIYSIFVSLNLDIVSSFTNSIESWAESFDGVSWSPIEDSGQLIEFDSFNEGKIVYKVNATIPAGAKIRFKIRTSGGNPQLGSFLLSNGVRVPSAQLSISKA